MAADERELLPLGTGFDVVRRGYDRRQVEDHLDRVEADLRILTADRDAAVGQAGELAQALDQTRAHVEELRAQVDRLSAPPESMEGLSERLQRMLRLAQDETREMRRRAGATATATTAEAEEYARTTVAGAEDHARSTVADADEYARTTADKADEYARTTVADAERAAHETLEAARAQARHTIARAEAEADRVRVRYDGAVADQERRRSEMEAEHTATMEHVHQECRRLEREAESSRQQVSDDFEVAMAARRQEAMRRLHTDEVQGRERAEALVVEADAEARRRVRAADDEVAELRRLRTRVSEQLATLRAALVALPQVDMFPDEDPEAPRPHDAATG